MQTYHSKHSCLHSKRNKPHKVMKKEEIITENKTKKDKIVTYL